MQKEKVMQVVDVFPEEVDVDELMEKLYLLQKIEAAERELARGEGIPDEEVEKRLDQWLN
jgi:predicted transcriptional regulator